MKKKIPIYLLAFVVLFLLSACGLRVKFGQNPAVLDNSLAYEEGTVFFKNKKNKDLEVRYVITNYQGPNQSGDIIFYLHGLGATELDWVEKDRLGRIYNDVLEAGGNTDQMPVVSFSLGRAFLLIDNLPRPYYADLETMFINEIIPYFKQYLNCNGKVYLIGHSMGGYNVLSLALRHPEMFPVVLTISPYTGPFSPFEPVFEQKGEEYGMPGLQVLLLQKTMTGAFGTPENWYAYNPFMLVEKNTEFPYIVLSTATNDLPGFNSSVKDFEAALNAKGVDHFFTEVEGDHRTVSKLLFEHFLAKIAELNK